ncbi:MAG: VWA domain-containing protein [Planctomycetota bacterium]|nr:MAG: VWA domain-containing protein [Planctomycetota bacterium]
MVNGRIGEAKQELYKAIVALPDFASVYVVFYDSADPWAFSDRWERVRSSMVKKLKTWLNNVGPSGGTEPTPAFRAVFALDARPDVIFFLSDGEIPPESIAEIRQMNARGKRVTINAIAFGDESGSQQLRQVAQEADGEFRQVRPKGAAGGNPP